MNKEEIINKIKERGYWRVEIQPKVFNAKLVPERKTLKELVEKSKVLLRGWDFPHYSHWNNPQNRDSLLGKDFIEGGSDWSSMIEFWRMYQSGLFLHLSSMQEDWFDVDNWFDSRPDLKQIKRGEVFNFVSGLYKIIEIFEFLHRLTKEGIYDGGVVLKIELHGTTNRMLRSLDNDGRILFFKYVSSQPSIEYEKEFSRDELLLEHKKLAIDAAIWIFESFNWDNVPRNVLENDLRNFYDRKF